MYKKRNELEILALFLGDYRKQLYLREISQTARIPLKTTQDALAALEKNRILKSAASGKNKYFRLNLDNIQAKLSLLQAEINQTSKFLEKHPVMKTFLKSVGTNNLIIIFGSFAKLVASEDSDLDMLIIKNEAQNIPYHLLPYNIHKIEFAEESFLKALEKQETLIKEIERNHIILTNHSFYINSMWNYYGRRQA